MENNIILRAESIDLGYSNKKTKYSVAKNVSIALKKRTLTALIGANGIGKSTLLKTIAGIQAPLEGSVILYDKSINSYSAAVLAREMSLVLTEKLPHSNLTVWEIIALGRQPYTNWIGNLTDDDNRKINNAIELTQIEHLQTKKHYEISDGQLQIVLIARALAQDTPIIILDEPTTHLDLLHKIALFKLLKKLAKETQKAILFSTHDIDLAIQLSDEIIIMTPETVIQDSPCNLIAKGNFTALYQDESIYFDSEKGKFIIS